MNLMTLRTPLLALLVSLAFPAQAQPQTLNGAPKSTPTTPAITPAAPAAEAGNGTLVQPPPAPAAPNNATVSPPTPPNPSGVEAAPAAEAQVAPPPPAPTLSDLGRSLRNYFTEDELALLFEYMKESVIASFKDEEVTLPPDLSFKLEILLVRMKKESGHYMDNLIKQLEKDLKKSIKEKLTPPPPKDQPYNPWLTKPWE